MATFYGPPLPSSMHYMTLPRPGRHNRPMITDNGPTIKLYANAVYYPNWRVYAQQTPKSLKLNRISHVFYAFAWVKDDGTVYLSDGHADTEILVDGTQGCLRSFAAIKREYCHLKLILSVGGGGSASIPFPIVAANPWTREKFAVTARELVQQYGFDGIDIDWEHPENPQQGYNYVQLLETTRKYLPAPHFLLTSALPAGVWCLKNISLETAHLYLDFINIMTYDFSGSWTDTCGHHAQLYTPATPHSPAAELSCQSTVAYLLGLGIPASKILLGIPAYGRSFLGASRVSDPYTGHGGEGGAFEYRDLPRPGAREYVDHLVGAAFCVGGDGGFVSYDNQETVKMKCQFVKQNDLGGVFFWTGTADKPHPNSLVQTAFDTLHSDT